MGKSGGFESCLPERYNILCAYADNTLILTQRRIVDGAITIREMEHIYARKAQVLKLCEANQDHYKLDRIKACIELRKTECAAFKRYKSELALFCREISAAKVNIKGKFFFFCSDNYILTEILQSKYLNNSCYSYLVLHACSLILLENKIMIFCSFVYTRPIKIGI